MNKDVTPCVGYAFVDRQELVSVFEMDKALACGTLFPELYLPINVYGKCPCREQKGEVCR